MCSLVNSQVRGFAFADPVHGPVRSLVNGLVNGFSGLFTSQFTWFLMGVRAVHYAIHWVQCGA